MDDLTTGGIYTPGSYDERTVSCLEALITERERTPWKLTTSAAIILSHEHMDRAATAIRTRVTEQDEESLRQRDFSGGLDEFTADVIMEQDQDTRLLELFVELATHAPSAVVRSELVRGLDLTSTMPWDDSARTTTLLEDNTAFLKEVAGTDPEGAARLASAMVGYMDVVFARSSFENEEEFDEYLKHVNRLVPTYTTTIESILALPGDTVPKDWIAYIGSSIREASDGPGTVYVGGAERMRDPGLDGNELLIGTLQQHPGSARARRMLELVERVRSGQHILTLQKGEE